MHKHIYCLGDGNVKLNLYVVYNNIHYFCREKMASDVGPVLSFDTSINFVLYKLSMANISLNKWRVPVMKQTFPHCLHWANIEKCLWLLCVPVEKKKNLLNWSVVTLLPSPVGIQILQRTNSWLIGTIHLDFLEHRGNCPYYWMQIYSEHNTDTSFV